MKKSYLIAITAMCMALALPVSAHHNSPWEDDVIEIGDMQGNHDAAILDLPVTGGSQTMDPADSSMPSGIEPQPNGVSIPAEAPDDALGPVNINTPDN
jgi:hypothetical protein